MKANLDKIILGGALLIFGAVCIWIFIVKPGVVSSTELPKLSDTPYQEIPVVQQEQDRVPWQPPQSQSADGKWVYDVFTPPRIYINPETNLFSVIPYTGPPEEAAFGIRLAQFQRPLYRLQFEGYIEEDPKNPQRSLLRIYNRESNASELVKVGQTSAAGEFRILDFQVSRTLDESGLLLLKETLLLEDTRTGQEVLLKPGEPRYSDQFILLFEGTLAGEDQRFEVQGEGESFLYEGATYTVERIDLTSGQVRVEKTSGEPSASVSATFRIPEFTAWRPLPPLPHAPATYLLTVL